MEGTFQDKLKNFIEILKKTFPLKLFYHLLLSLDPNVNVDGLSYSLHYV
jgi:hypothetical protein